MTSKVNVICKMQRVLGKKLVPKYNFFTLQPTDGKLFNDKKQPANTQEDQDGVANGSGQCCWQHLATAQSLANDKHVLSANGHDQTEAEHKPSEEGG